MKYVKNPHPRNLSPLRKIQPRKQRKQRRMLHVV
jgi:hypothetical protein